MSIERKARVQEISDEVRRLAESLSEPTSVVFSIPDLTRRDRDVVRSAVGHWCRKHNWHGMTHYERDEDTLEVIFAKKLAPGEEREKRSYPVSVRRKRFEPFAKEIYNLLDSGAMYIEVKIPEQFKPNEREVIRKYANNWMRRNGWKGRTNFDHVRKVLTVQLLTRKDHQCLHCLRTGRWRVDGKLLCSDHKNEWIIRASPEELDLATIEEIK